MRRYFLIAFVSLLILAFIYLTYSYLEAKSIENYLYGSNYISKNLAELKNIRIDYELQITQRDTWRSNNRNLSQTLHNTSYPVNITLKIIATDEDAHDITIVTDLDYDKRYEFFYYDSLVRETFEVKEIGLVKELAFLANIPNLKKMTDDERMVYMERLLSPMRVFVEIDGTTGFYHLKLSDVSLLDFDDELYTSVKDDIDGILSK